MMLSELRNFDKDAFQVTEEVQLATEELHQQGELDAADELMDARLPYGTVAYFSQLAKNGRVRARTATTVAELERAEDFHDELHDYLQWQEQHKELLTNEADKGWADSATSLIVLKDGDIFWSIAKALCRIEGAEPCLDYIEAHKIESEPGRDPYINAIALNTVYRTAFEHGLPMPERARSFATTLLDQLEVNPISRELGQRLLLGHGYDGRARFPIGAIGEPMYNAYAETLWQSQ